MARRLVWIDVKGFRGYGCSECEWRFAVGENGNPETLAISCARPQFAAHVCSENPYPVGGGRGVEKHTGVMRPKQS